MMIAMYNKDTLWVSSLASFVLWHYMLAPFDLVVRIRLDLPCQHTKTALFFNFVSPYSTARFKLYARKYILASINTFSPSSQPMFASKDSMLASKGSILASKGNMLSCMILLAIEIDARVQSLARIRDRAVSRCTRARLHALVHYFTRDLN